jgi:hypothetical protein
MNAIINNRLSEIDSEIAKKVVEKYMEWVDIRKK